MSHTFNIPVGDNEKLKTIVEAVQKDVRLQTFWKCSNVMAIERMEYTDHGPIHVKIVANSALRLLRILVKNGVVPSVVKDYSLSIEDAEVVVVLAAIFHDLGMIVARDGHEEFSVHFAYDFCQKHLATVYNEEERTILTSEVLHAVLAHRPQQRVLTLEAGLVRVADALDMEQGRARIPFESGKIDIHSVSALAIEQVEISEGTEKPILIRIMMSNIAPVRICEQ